jgi:hypothetical protein
MNLDQQVCSLDLAKRLKELGVKQESCFIWAKTKLPDTWQVAFTNRIGFTFWNGAAVAGHRYDEFEHYAAFTVAKLGQRMEQSTKGVFLKAYCDVMDVRLEDIKGPDRSLMAANLMTDPNIAAKMLI